MSKLFKTAATETKDITNEIHNWYNQKGIESALNGNVLINAESTETESNYENSDEIIFTFKEPISLETFRNFLKAAGYKLKPVYEYTDVDENVEFSVDGNIGTYKWHWISNRKSNIKIGEFKMKKTEAQKIVEVNLIKALNRNDAKAVREACIVLKAMDEESIHPADADARTVNADIEYFVCNNPSDGNARSVLGSVNKALNEVIKDLKHAKAAGYDVDIQAGIDKFSNDVKAIVDVVED